MNLEPYEALARLGRLVEESGGTESALDSVVKAIADSLRLPYVALELRLGDGWRQAAVYSHDIPFEVTAFPLISQRETVGRLVVGTRSRDDRLSPDDERLLADLARQAGPATHAVALRRRLMLPGPAWSPRGKRNAVGCDATCMTAWAPRWPA